MVDCEPVQEWKMLQDEFLAARATLERARISIETMSVAGFPIEQMDVEFETEERARATLARIRKRIDQLEAERPLRASPAHASIDCP